MADVNIVFPKQKYKITISSRAYGDLDYKQRKNWNSSNRLQRERANVLFDRLRETLHSLANNIAPNEILPTGKNGELVYEIPDGIGRIILNITDTDDGSVITVIDWIWDYKNVSDSWWSIVEDKNYGQKPILELIQRVVNPNLRDKFKL